MKKNLVVCPAGDNSLHPNWINGNPEFDLALLYYGNNDEILENYKNNSKILIKKKSEKWHLIKFFIENNLEFIDNYDYIWFPDDDLDIKCEDINKLFDTHKKYNLKLSQPSVSGFVSYDIERKVNNSILRYTNFVEILCPLMSKECLNTLMDTFTINESGWGMDYLWVKKLGNPIDKIAIIDEVTVEHTKPVGGDYSGRFSRSPMDEFIELMSVNGLNANQMIYFQISK